MSQSVLYAEHRPHVALPHSEGAEDTRVGQTSRLASSLVSSAGR